MPVSRTITAVFILSAILCGCQRQVHPTGFDMETILSEHMVGYVCSLIGFNVGDGERVRGYLLVPDTASPDSKAPAVVLLHDHGARFDIGKEKLVRPLAQKHIVRSAEQWADRYFDGVFFGDFLASEGFTVIVADAIYWGERSSPEAQEWSRLSFGNGADMATENPDCRKHRIRELKQEVYEGQREIYANYEKAGRCWAEKILEDDIATAELVASLPFVDTSRIYAAGFSMGAHRCWLLSAFSDRIRHRCCSSAGKMTTCSLKNLSEKHSPGCRQFIQTVLPAHSSPVSSLEATIAARPYRTAYCISSYQEMSCLKNNNIKNRNLTGTDGLQAARL